MPGLKAGTGFFFMGQPQPPGNIFRMRIQLPVLCGADKNRERRKSHRPVKMLLLMAQ